MTKKDTKKPGTKHAPPQDNIKTVTVIPQGFISAKAFATKCGVSQSGLTQARQAGKFAANSMRYIKPEKQRAQIYYHWDSLGPEFIRSRPRSRWPKWFIKAEADAAVAVTGEHEAAQGGNPTGTGMLTKMGTTVVTDLNSAKLQSEKLKIERQELELLVAKNAVLDMEEVAGLFAEVGMAIKQSLLAIAPRVAPLVAAENVPHKCLKILEEEITKALKNIDTLKDFVEDKKKKA